MLKEEMIFNTKEAINYFAKRTGVIIFDQLKRDLKRELMEIEDSNIEYWNEYLKEINLQIKIGKFSFGIFPIKISKDLPQNFTDFFNHYGDKYKLEDYPNFNNYWSIYKKLKRMKEDIISRLNVILRERILGECDF